MAALQIAAGERENLHAVCVVGQPADRNGDQAIEEREVQAADQAQLAVGNLEGVLDRLGEDREELAVEEVQDIDEPQHAERKPGSGAGVAGAQMAVDQSWSVHFVALHCSDARPAF